MAIIIKPLSNLDIKNAQNGRLRDGEGLVLDITPNSKTWRLIYDKLITKKRTCPFYKAALKWKTFKTTQVTEKTMVQDWRRLENHIFPTLANLPLERINSKLLVDTLQKVYRKGQTSVIEKVLRTIEGIMDHAENIGLIEMHNCHKAKKAFL